MKQYLETLSGYNLWANEQLMGWIKTAGEAVCTLQQKSSFSTIRATIIHMWDAHVIWQNRLNGVSPHHWPGKDFNGDTLQAAHGLLGASEDTLNWVKLGNESLISGDVHYESLKGEKFKSKASEIITHVMNHSTFHRGQVVSMLRNAGFSELTSTDMIAYYRNYNYPGY